MSLYNWNRFLESNNNDELSNNVKDIFQELIDDGYAEIINSDVYDTKGVVISINIPNDHVASNNFDNFFNQKKKHFSVFQSIKDCIDRLKSAHIEEIDVNYDYYEDAEHNYVIDIIITEGSVESGYFWKIDNDGLIRLDFDDLKEYLKLPKNVSIGMSSDGRRKLLAIYFKTEEELESYSKDIIEKMLNIKINDKELLEDYEWSYSTRSGAEMSKYKIYKNYDRHRSTGYYDNRVDIVHYIDFALNKDLNFSW